MTQLKRAVITPLSNQQTATNLSIVNGIPESLFNAMATTSATGHAATASHCYGNGLFTDTVLVVYEADTVNYKVLPAADRGRPAAVMLAEHTPPLYPYLGP